MIRAAEYCRKTGKPFFGICLGMQIAVIEWARNVLNLAGANSTEFDKSTPHPVIVEMPEVDQVNLGGTMRLGLRQSNLVPNTLAARIYANAASVQERHRHRYEVNPQYVDKLRRSGLVFGGLAEKLHSNDLSLRMETIELPQPITISTLTKALSSPQTKPSVDTFASTDAKLTEAKMIAPPKAYVIGSGSVMTSEATAAAHATINAKDTKLDMSPTTVAGVQVPKCEEVVVPAAIGLQFSSPTTKSSAELLPEMHPFYFAVQFHPEFLSRPMSASPPFRAFVQAALQL
jgi:CTP synthase (UTP-ammonia lyase)